MNLEKIKLLGGAEVMVDWDNKPTTCKKCDKTIRFGVTKNNKYMPISQTPAGWQSHFTDCSNPEDFRGRGRMGMLDQEVERERNQNFLNSIKNNNAIT